MKKLITLLTFILSCSFVFSQSKDCNLQTSKYNNIKTVDTNDIICLAKNSENKNLIIHSFGIWCSPCITNLPFSLELIENYDIDFYILLILKENHKRVRKSLAFLKEQYPTLKILILKDAVYGETNRKWKKYDKFIDEITPTKFEKIGGLGKYLVLDNKGKVIMSTTYKDHMKDEKTDEGMLNRLVKPLLTKK